MKEKLYTIPVMDAFKENDECPFCFIERNLEQNALDFILGTAYMEGDIREATDKIGFCHTHLKKMYDYGNALGNALMLKTHYQKLNKELHDQIKEYKSGKVSLKEKLSTHNDKKQGCLDPIASFVSRKESTCYVCNYAEQTYQRYMDTFFYLYKTEPSFRELLQNGKGFCFHHFGEIMETARTALSDKEKASFYPLLFSLMETNMKRIEEDLSWFVNKFDYRYKDADWKTSKDAIPRGIQKLHGGYPQDPPYRESK